MSVPDQFFGHISLVVAVLPRVSLMLQSFAHCCLHELRAVNQALKLLLIWFGDAINVELMNKPELGVAFFGICPSQVDLLALRLEGRHQRLVPLARRFGNCVFAGFYTDLHIVKPAAWG